MARAALARYRQDAGGKAGGDVWEIRSPVAGTVLRVIQESEAPVSAGAPIVEIGDPRELEIVVDVLTADAGAIAPGAPVELDHGGGAPVAAGRVRLVEPSAFTKVSALGVEEQRVNVVIDFAEPPSAWGNVGDGHRVDARIGVETRADALLVPNGALFRRGDGWAVFVVESGRARRATVELGPRNGLVAVVLQGLVADEQVIVYPSDAVRDGIRVSVRARPRGRECGSRRTASGAMPVQHPLIAAVLEEIAHCAHRQLRVAQRPQQEIPAAITERLQVPGPGPKRVRRLWRRLGRKLISVNAGTGGPTRIHQDGSRIREGGASVTGEDRARPTEDAPAAALLAVVTGMLRELRPYAAIGDVRLDDRIDRDLGLDSLSRAELQLRVERAFGVRLPERLATTARNTAELLDAIAKAEHGAAPPLLDLMVLGATGRRHPQRGSMILDAFRWHLEHHPDREHVTLIDGEAIAESFSYAQMWTAAGEIAGGLRASGIVRGDAVALMLPTSGAFLQAFLGAMIAGAVPVPMHPPLRWSEIAEHVRGRAAILANAEARVLVTVPEAMFVGNIARATLPQLRAVVTVDQLRRPDGEPDVGVPLRPGILR